MRRAMAMVFALISLCCSPVRASEPVAWLGTVELPGGILLEFSASLKSDSGTISIPMQGAMNIPLSDVSTEPHRLRFTIRLAGTPETAHARFDLAVDEGGRTARGLLRQSGGEFSVVARRLEDGEAPAGMNRPQEPVPPFPYEAAEVRFQNPEANISLAGTLTVPRTPGRHPAVVLISGSGPQDRDEFILGHKPFLVIADHLTRAGIAVLRYDDRGVGESSGSFDRATSDDFATDAAAAVRFLAAHPDIDPQRIGLVGHSEGGLIAPIVASTMPEVAFVVLLAAPGVPGIEILEVQARLIAVAMGKPEDEARRDAEENTTLLRAIASDAPSEEIARRLKDVAIRQVRASPDAATLTEQEVNERAFEVAKAQVEQVQSPWFRRFLVLEPRDYLSRVSCPVLAVNGTVDLQVDHRQNLPEIEKAIRSGGNQDVTIAAMPGLNHLFQKSATGSPSEYAQLEETFNADVLELLASWLRQKSGLKD